MEDFPEPLEMTNSITKMKLMLLALCFKFITSQEESISPYKEIKKFVKTFKPRGMNTSTYYLLFIDEKHNKLIVGARNSVFLVNLDDMKSYEYWNVPQRPGDNAFVKMMLPFGDRILLCWVEKASTGSCTWRTRTTLDEAPESNQGYVFKSKEKYDAPSSSPDQNDTAIITEDGTLFVGTFLALGGHSFIYSKRFKHPQLKEVFSSRLSSFYKDVHFVKSFEIGPYVYFFFRERSLECSSCGKVKTSRVARVCKGDRGGRYRLLNTFVTLQKAKLMCSDGKNYALNFNEIQDVWWDNRTGQFYAAFSSQPNGPAISAICIYSLSSINRIFIKSDFKSFSETKGWTIKRNKIGEYFPGCKVNPKYLKRSSSVADGVMATKDMLTLAYVDLMENTLMSDGVKPVGSKAWFIRNGIRMTAISLDVVGQNIVVYASTDRGSVVKVAQPQGLSQPCLYSEMEVYPSNKREVIKTMVIDQGRHVLYLGTRYSLTQLTLDQCERYQYDKSACISAADPDQYCGWDNNKYRCSSLLSHGETQQNLTICPKVRKVDLSVGWEGERSREILGVQHGNWSAWGKWSECSTETWAGVRSRSRTCTNPLPRSGGRTCVGESMQYEPCSLEIQEEKRNVWTSPAMPLNSTTNEAVKFKITAMARGYKLTVLDLELSNETIDCGKDPEQCGKGKWKPWGKWSVCAVEGFQIRRRNCSKEPCLGERLQERNCTKTNERCEGVIDCGWEVWSSCFCDHGLNLAKKGSGIMYRVRKCCRTCPNEASCANSVEFKMCFCKRPTSVLGQEQGLHPSNKVIAGPVIGVNVGSVVVIGLCVVVICYLNL
ncbi:LOW QUALITY PROTEIN: semaphorin-5A-like [Acropora millepora]|uniref:LOW QUALITY PROTEIN: semaphorin-5A-like n=1 Tax=Acropora millepora TaxID=45264 RepID=UPI001CF3283A|nr:LOW QUALITY PROTEIN: semaphorin-5A-like [Acropora millepora]